jgi:alkylation response protein AidB-like acyl-CoA dehydrogenase
LSGEQEDLINALQQLLRANCDTARVRAAALCGHDAGLWKILIDAGYIDMAMAEDEDDRAGLVELSLVAETCGYALASVPVLETFVATRLLGRLDVWRQLREELASVSSGDEIITLDIANGDVIPSGAVASWLLHETARGVWLTRVEAAERLPAYGNLPTARRVSVETTGTGRLLASGSAAREAWLMAREEWKILIACSLVGAAEHAKRLAVEFANSRMTRGIPIGSLQAVSHKIVDSELLISSARNLARKAAWFHDNEPAERRQLATQAFVHAARAASKGVEIAVHVHGGAGVALESDVALCFQRVKPLISLVGDPTRELVVAADRAQ